MPSFTVYYGIKIFYYFAIKTWNDFIFELINLLLLSFNVYYGMKISYYFAIKTWNDFTFELQFFDNKSKHEVQHIFCFWNLSKIRNCFLHLWSTWWLMSCGRGKILWLASGLFSRAVGTWGGGQGYDPPPTPILTN